ncbi:GWxTD domain-containing protein [Stygiobacter electus]|uniref:GWxTD domain-containing protein n=1 Tax=Stygiobacter electus TaxID=3032292 RepID=A0AAE3NW35_9BACT|nr:GWxTD domain-containing protein [Stygiobacter electus]MDF1611136.1 GWxTD domain-containing protein [Stygiobacter electus]
MKKLIIILLSIYSFSFSQVEYWNNKNQSLFTIPFYFDVAQHKSNQPAKTRIDVYVQVPYSSLSFVKRENVFDANYNITLTLINESKNNIISEKSWKEKITTDNFDKTVSRNNYNISLKNWELTPGKYFLKTIFEDGNSRRTATKEIPLNVRSINDSIDISDLMFISEVIKDSTGDKIVPNISCVFTNKDTSISFFFTAYSNKHQDVFFEYQLNDLKKNETIKQMHPQSLKAGSNFVSFTINKINLTLGTYNLKVVLKNSDWKEVSSTDKNFISKIFGIPNSINDLDKAIEQMIYIASPKELDFIKDATDYETKMNRFLAFWESRKPNKQSEDNPVLYEYYRRIEYANKNFKGFGEGWKSDMGMIYVTFGPPSYVERHPLDSDSKPYEIWDYYDLNRSFTFVDETGFGDYRLINPDYSRWPGYRP